MRLLTLPLPASRCASPSLLFELPSRCCLEEAPFPPPFSLGLLSAERVPEAAELLVDAFFLAPADGAADGPRAPPGKAAATREERLRLTARGLEWRLGSRLHAPDISLSLESSLLLALKDEETDKLAACAELSLRPRDGRLPAEFTVPPLFLLHSAGLAPYLCNLAVSRHYRRRRLAWRLLAACETLVRNEWQQSELYLHVDMFNEGAAALYSRAGYKPLPSFDKAAAASSAAQNGDSPGGRVAPVLNRYHVKRLIATDDVNMMTTAASSGMRAEGAVTEAACEAFATGRGHSLATGGSGREADEAVERRAPRIEHSQEDGVPAL